MPSYRKSAQVDMTHGSVLGRAALFALPICAGNILQLLYSTVDTLVIGNFCDTTALASVATSSQPLEILLCVFVGIGSGISILVSQAVGRADHDQLQKLVRTSVWLLFAASLPLTVIGFLLGPWMLRLMQVPADAMPGAVLYLRITMLGILGNMGYNFNAGLLRGIGNSSSSLLLLFISCAANIVLDLVLTGIAWAIGIGLVCAVLQYDKVPVLRRLVGAYIQLSRNTPLLVQLFFIYYGLPKVGIKTNAEICGIAGLAFLGGSYMAEAFRSGLEAIEPIQTESAYSLGMTRLQTLRYVILPQAVSTSVPAFMANVIFLLKETSVFSAVSLMDLMFTAKDLIGLYYKTPECLFLLVVFYLILLLPVSLLGSWLERRVRYAGFGS